MSRMLEKKTVHSVCRLMCHTCGRIARWSIDDLIHRVVRWPECCGDLMLQVTGAKVAEPPPRQRCGCSTHH